MGTFDHGNPQRNFLKIDERENEKQKRKRERERERERERWPMRWATI